MDGAAEAVVQDVPEEAVAELGGIARDAEDGDGPRREERAECACPRQVVLL
jgi:hypothetical protein